MNNSLGGLLCPDCERNSFNTHYNAIVRHAKEQYMLDKQGLLNRHKVAAAIMIAILKTKPIKKVDPLYYLEDNNGELTPWPLNESLAITVALSVLRAFIMARVDVAFSGKIVSKQIFEDVTLQDREIFDNGVPISESERNEWKWELYHIRQDGAYNLLSIAHILKEIEKNCKLTYFLENQDIKPTYPDPKNLTEDSIEMLSLDDVLC